MWSFDLRLDGASGEMSDLLLKVMSVSFLLYDLDLDLVRCVFRGIVCIFMYFASQGIIYKVLGLVFRGASWQYRVISIRSILRPIHMVARKRSLMLIGSCGFADRDIVDPITLSECRMCERASMYCISAP